MPGRRSRRKKKKPTMTTRRMSDEEFDRLQQEKEQRRITARARRRKALEVLGTDPTTERKARDEARTARRDLAQREAALIEAGETVSQKPSTYKRKIKRK
jgi:hypothetical protein